MITCPPIACQPSKAEVRRKRIVDVARRLFIEHGFHSTGVALIAKHSAIAIGQIYRDFAAKEDIVAAIVTRDSQDFIQADSLMVAIEACDEAAIRTWIRDLFVSCGGAEKDRLFLEIAAEVGRNARMAGIFADCRGTVRCRLSQALAVIAPGDALENQRLALADLIMTISVGLLQQRLTADASRSVVDLEGVRKRLVTFVEREIEGLREDALRAA